MTKISFEGLSCMQKCCVWRCCAPRSLALVHRPFHLVLVRVRFQPYAVPRLRPAAPPCQVPRLLRRRKLFIQYQPHQSRGSQFQAVCSVIVYRRNSSRSILLRIRHWRSRVTCNLYPHDRRSHLSRMCRAPGRCLLSWYSSGSFLAQDQARKASIKAGTSLAGLSARGKRCFASTSRCAPYHLSFITAHS